MTDRDSLCYVITSGSFGIVVRKSVMPINAIHFCTSCKRNFLNSSRDFSNIHFYFKSF